MSEHAVRGYETVVAPSTLPRRLWLVTPGARRPPVGRRRGGDRADRQHDPRAEPDPPRHVPGPRLHGAVRLARPREAHLSVEALVLGFLAGGMAGVVLTGTTEVYVLPDALRHQRADRLIEEGGKALILVAVATLVKVRVPRDGMVLGATVGAGFAAFESAGYALGALIQYSDDHPLLNVLQTEALRAVLAPFGHITWTAILGGAIFASAWTTGRLRSIAACYGRSSAWSRCTAVGTRRMAGRSGSARGSAARAGCSAGPTPPRGSARRAAGPAPLPDRLRRHGRIVGRSASCGPIRRWRAYQIDRWTEAHPRPKPARAIAHRERCPSPPALPYRALAGALATALEAVG